MSKHIKKYSLATYSITTVVLIAAVSALYFAKLLNSPTASLIWQNNNNQNYTWQVLTFSLTGSKDQVDPFDYENVVFSALISHEDGHGLLDDPEPTKVYGFWDGGRVWRIRFAPTRPGVWTVTSKFTSPNPDPALDNKVQSYVVVPPHPDAPSIFQKGGMIRVTPATDNERSWFTYADGTTPFHWLAYKAHSIYSTNGTMQDFRNVISKAAARNYSVISWQGIHQVRRYPRTNGRTSSGNVFVFSRKEDSLGSADPLQAEAARTYWNEMDSLVRYGAQNGLVLGLGIGSYDVMRKYDVETHKRVWAYLAARYNALPVVPIFTQEYNLLHHEPPCRETEIPITIGTIERCAFSEQEVRERTSDYFELMSFYKTRDPYHRAVGIHSAVLAQTLCGAQGFDSASCTLPSTYKNYSDWLASAPSDFLLLQLGHRKVPNPNVMEELQRVLKIENIKKPVIIDEYNFEGFGDEATVQRSSGSTCSFSLKGKKFMSGETLLSLDRTDQILKPYLYTDEHHIRESMLVAMQGGAVGYTTAAQGTYAMIVSRNSPKSTMNWGPVLLWNEGLELKGSSFLQHIRNVYAQFPIRSYFPDNVAIERDGGGKFADRVSVLSRKAGKGKAYLIAYLPPVDQPCLPYLDLEQYFTGIRIKGLKAGGTYVGRMMSTRSNTQWEQLLIADMQGKLPLPALPSGGNQSIVNRDMLFHVENTETAKGIQPFYVGYHPEEDRYVHTTYATTMQNIYVPIGFENRGIGFYLAASGSFIPTVDVYGSRRYSTDDTAALRQMRSPPPTRHRFVVSEEEQQRLLDQGWFDEGRKAFVFTRPGYKRAPLYRMIPPNNNESRHYVTDGMEKENLLAAGWLIDEGFGPYFVVIDPLDP